MDEQFIFVAFFFAYIYFLVMAIRALMTQDMRSFFVNLVTVAVLGAVQQSFFLGN